MVVVRVRVLVAVGVPVRVEEVPAATVPVVEVTLVADGAAAEVAAPPCQSPTPARYSKKGVGQVLEDPVLAGVGRGQERAVPAALA